MNIIWFATWTGGWCGVGGRWRKDSFECMSDNITIWGCGKEHVEDTDVE